MKKCRCMVITENCRKIDHVSLILDMFICLKHFLCTILGNKFNSEILVGWPISKRFNENVIGQTLKKCWFLCCYRPNPPKKIAIQRGFFFFSKTLAGTTCLSSKTVFSMIRTMLHWLSLEIFFLYGQHFGLCTIYSKRSIKIWSGLKKKKKKEATYLLILKLMCRSTANKELFRDGLDCFNWERETENSCKKLKKSIDDKIKPTLLSLAWLQSLAMVKWSYWTLFW